MALRLIASAMRSRQIREAITGDGIREIAFNAITESGGEDEGFFSKILDWGKNLVGWAIGGLKKVVSWLGFSFTKVWQWITTGASAMYNFNWLIKEEVIEEKVKALKLSLAGRFGEFAGNILGYSLCGALPGVAMLKFNPQLALYLLETVGEEALDELTSQLGNIAADTAKSAMTILALKAYVNVRSWALNPDNPVANFMVEAGLVKEETLEGIRKAAKEKDSFTFAEYVEEKIESIKSETLRTFVEELVEGFFESCQEAGFVVAGGLDSWFGGRQLDELYTTGQERRVEILI